jgi:hypothetical protein
MTWLEANRMLVISDYHKAFCAAFSRTDVKLFHLNALRKRNGWKVGRSGERYKGRNRRFTPEEMHWLEINRTMPIADYTAAFCDSFAKTGVTAAQLHGLRKRMGWKTGRTGHFAKGAAPMNKGKKMPYHPNSARTRRTKDGYIEISIEETNPHTGFERRYVQKHRWLWEQKNGPVPDGMALKCLDSNKANTDPSNWEPVPRAVLARLNGGCHRTRLAYDAAPAELKPTVMAVAKLEHGIREKSERDNRSSSSLTSQAAE